MSYKKDFNIYVACKLGTFRGINFHKDGSAWKVLSKNIQNLPALDEDSGITEMCWGDPDEMDILIGLKNQHVKIYDTDYKAFTSSVNVKFGEGQICGLSKYDGYLLTAIQSGLIRVCKFKQKDGDVFDTESTIEKMRHSKTNENIVAIGCKGSSDLRLLDLSTKQYTFESKNVKPNELQLHYPIWPSDLTFLPNSSGLVAVATRYGQVRLYDTNSSQRRPVLNVSIPDQSLISMSSTHRDKCVVVGSGRGIMKLVDFRSKDIVMNSYKGSVGSIRSIACSPTEPFIVSVGLDRYIKIHHMDTTELLYKGYLKMRLNCVIVRSQMILPDVKDEDEKMHHEENSDDDIEVIAQYDHLFDGMGVIEEPSSVNKRQ